MDIAAAGEFDRVGNKVVEDLPQADRIGVGTGRAVVLIGERQPLGFGIRAQVIGD